MFLVLGIISCVQFVVVALVGVTRGYAVQGNLSESLFIGGGAWGMLACNRMFSSRIALSSTIALMMFLSLTVVAHFGQGKHLALGKKHFEQDRYEEALAEFKMETDPWRSHISYNFHERDAMRGTAETYCRLGEFDRACETYEAMIVRYENTVAPVMLAQMRGALEDLPKDQKAAEAEDDLLVKSGLLFKNGLAYFVPLNCPKKALETFQQIVELDIPDNLKTPARNGVREIQEKKRFGTYILRPTG